MIFKQIAKDHILHHKQMTLLFIVILISTLTNGQDTIGVYFNLTKIKTGTNFGTTLILKSDSTFQYTFKGDLYNDSAEGTFSQINKLIRLKYTTLDYSILTIQNDKILYTQPPQTIKVDEQIKFPNPVAHLWPTEMIKKNKKLIVIKTSGNTEKNLKMKFKKLTNK
jgi:hypothetical protein